ncbi:hypothetical protein ACH4D4_13755 [Streptomyces pristinaespiralis]|uniref:hypothetical protein n=1 Tax=Streptomyces pristinaespiralis TaxID=38300 RepID=UPI0037B5F585
MEHPCPDAAVARLRAEGHDLKDEDVTRLSPLKDRHIDFLGRHLFDIKALRPFRTRTPPRTTTTGGRRPAAGGRHTRPTRLLVASRGGLAPDVSWRLRGRRHNTSGALSSAGSLDTR